MAAERLAIRATVSRPGFRLEVDETLGVEGCTAVFGPSGGGKTTLLRVIAGFTRPDAGRITFGDAVWFDSETRAHTPPHRRPVGFLFQDARLFEHLSVRGNLEYADARSPRRADGAYGLDDVVAALDLASLLDRPAPSLSGGERQRAALGRTLMTRPELLLLDEPLAALDRRRKADILPHLEALPQRFGVRTLYVSHDVGEVARLAQEILVLDAGRVLTRGPAAEVVARLGALPATEGVEASALLEGAVARHDARLRLTVVLVGGVEVTIPMVERLAPGAAVRLRVRADDVALATQRPERISIRNVLAGTVADVAVQDDAATALVAVDLAGARLFARVTRSAAEDLDLAPGREVFALVKSMAFDGRV